MRFPDLPPAVGRLADPAGAFVTLRSNGRLRGCMGCIDAAQDPRFKPLTVEEIAGLEIEISVISELQPARPEGLELGIHGIVVSRGASRGLLLPQVALEHNWSATQFLEAACRKARLEPSAWRGPETKLFAFTAEVFSEISLVPLGRQLAGG